MQGDQVVNEKICQYKICLETVQQFFRGFWSMIWTKIGQKLDLKVDMRTKTGFEEDNIWIYEPKPGQK